MFWCYPVWLEHSAFLYPSPFFTFMPCCKHGKHCSRANICRHLIKPKNIICYVWFAQLTSVRCAVFWHTAASRKDVKILSPAGKGLENAGKRVYSCEQEFADMLRLAYFELFDPKPSPLGKGHQPAAQVVPPALSQPWGQSGTWWASHPGLDAISSSTKALGQLLGTFMFAFPSKQSSWWWLKMLLI